MHIHSHLSRLLMAAALACTFTAARADGDAARGKQLYAQRCAACHSIEHNGTGPAHQGLIGRRAGTAPGFAYSAALKSASVVWNKASLEAWLTDPEKLIPGQKMYFSVPDAQERADVVAWLLQASAKK